MRSVLKQRFAEMADLLSIMGQDESLTMQLESITTLCINSLRDGNKLIFAGNGGSAADSQHLAAELVSRFSLDRPGLPATAITTDSSIVTAIANDYGYQQLFARQIQAIGREGDVMFGITTSGTSENVLNGLSEAKKMGLNTVALTGAAGIDEGHQAVCDYCIRVPSADTPRIQEGHIAIGHLLCELIEREMFSAPQSQE